MKGFAKLSGGGGLSIQTSFVQLEFKKLDNFQGFAQFIKMGGGIDLVEFRKNYKAIAG